MQTLPTDKGQVLISFIITYYNLPADMLRECVASICALSIPAGKREIILIDDGSDISAETILGDMAREVTCVRQENQGLSVARNTGMAMAQGKYIQFVDGDDALIKSNYNRCVNMLDSQQPDILMFRTGKPTGKFRQCKAETSTGTRYMQSHNLRASACGYLFKKELLGRRAAALGAQAFTPGILHEDEEFTPLLFLRAGQVVSTDIEAYYYRQRKGSITHKHNEAWTNHRLDDFERVIIRLHKIAETLDSDSKEALNRRVNQLCMDYIYNTLLLTKKISMTRERAERLRTHGLFPLANRHYTVKYSLFRLITKHMFK